MHYLSPLYSFRTDLLPKRSQIYHIISLNIHATQRTQKWYFIFLSIYTTQCVSLTDTQKVSARARQRMADGAVAVCVVVVRRHFLPTATILEFVYYHPFSLVLSHRTHRLSKRGESVLQLKLESDVRRGQLEQGAIVRQYESCKNRVS